MKPTPVSDENSTTALIEQFYKFIDYVSTLAMIKEILKYLSTKILSENTRKVIVKRLDNVQQKMYNVYSAGRTSAVLFFREPMKYTSGMVRCPNFMVTAISLILPDSITDVTEPLGHYLMIPLRILQQTYIGAHISELFNVPTNNIKAKEHIKTIKDAVKRQIKAVRMNYFIMTAV